MSLYLKRSVLLLIIFITLSVFITSCSKSGTGINPKPPAEAVISITAFSPAKALPNSIVSISGSNFNTALANNVVKFNGVSAQVNSVNATEIVVTVPGTATTGKIEVSSNGKKVTSATDFTVTTATMSDFASLSAVSIDQIAFDFSGQLYGEDGRNIYKISSTGKIDFRVNISSNSFRGIAFDKAGNLYVAPGINVTKIAPDNTVTVLAGQIISSGGLADGTGASARFSGSSYGIANDANGNIYYGDASAMRKVTTAGVVTTLAGNLKFEQGYVDGKGAEAKFGFMTRFTVDQTTGDIYVVDSDHYCIRKITQDGVVTTVIGSTIVGLVDGEGIKARIFGPQALAADGKGNIFFSDADFSAPIYKIRMINKLGQVSTLITGTSFTTLVNGQLGTATANRPLGIAFDPSGNLYIVNSGANKISKVTFN
jgi:sugar lactone lactonase YvrE